MSYTVIMAAHNEEKYIGRALSSVFSQTLRPSEVIVVLDRCSDGTGEIARKYPVTIVEKKEKRWVFSYSENLEIARRMVKTPFFAIVDADVELEPNYFEVLFSEIDEETGCISGKVVTRSRTLLGRLLSLWEKTYKLALERRPRGCALLVRNDLVERIGGIRDVPAPDTYIQDQVKRLGFKVRVVEGVRAYHVRDVTLRRALKTQFSAGVARYLMGKGLLRTLGHSIVRLRPLVIVGYLYAMLSGEKRELRRKLELETAFLKPSY
jgi:glycosyltransferase involved in cell wall biosynthesis